MCSQLLLQVVVKLSFYLDKTMVTKDYIMRNEPAVENVKKEAVSRNTASFALESS